MIPCWAFLTGKQNLYRCGFTVTAHNFNDSDSLHTVDFGSVLADGVTLDTVIYICSWPLSCTDKATRGHAESTWTRVWLRLQRRFRSLYEGKFTEVDDLGHKWPVGSETDIKELAHG